MKSEDEIRKKLEYYEGILAGIEIAESIDIVDVFVRFSDSLPEQAMELLKTSALRDEILDKCDPIDHDWMKRALNAMNIYAQQILADRISILQWILGGGQ